MGAVVRPWAHEAVNLQASGDGTLIRGRPEDYEGQPLFSSYWKWKEDLIWSSGCAQRSGAAQKRLSDWSISPSQLQGTSVECPRARSRSRTIVHVLLMVVYPSSEGSRASPVLWETVDSEAA